MPARAPRPMTFQCERCYREVTEIRSPRPTPAYSQACAPGTVAVVPFDDLGNRRPAKADEHNCEHESEKTTHRTSFGEI